VTAETLDVPANLRHLYGHLLENRLVRPIRGSVEADLSVLPGQVRAMLHQGDPAWELHVPPDVARLIRERGLFGYSVGART